MNGTEIVTLVNTLAQLLLQLGLSWDDVSRAVARARDEGREFDLTDVERFAEKADVSRAKLQEALDRARAREQGGEPSP